MWFQQKSNDLAANQVELSQCRMKHNELQLHTMTYKAEYVRMNGVDVQGMHNV